MTQVVIDDIIPRTQIIAAASQTVFNTNWTADAASDIDVYRRADGVEADDVTQIVSSSLYNVTFIGSSQTVRVTFLSGVDADDIITIVRNTPAERTNLYINTNFVPSMLNQDFGILTLVDQQAQMYDTVIAPHYNVSATIDFKDKILPILTANQVWAMNNDNTEIIAYNVPAGGGIAPADAKYLLQQADSELPNAQAMGALASGIVVNTNVTGVQITRLVVPVSGQTLVANGSGITGDITIGFAQNASLPGVEGIQLPFGTTGQRPGSPTTTNFRFNTDSDFLEYWDGADWVQLSETDGVTTAQGTENQVLVNGTFGAPVEGAIILTTPQDIGLTSSPTFSNITLTGGLIKGINAGTVLTLVDTASAVNGIRIANNITGNGPSFASFGADANIALNIGSKGAAPIGLITAATNQALFIYSGTANQHLTRFSFSNTAADRVVTWQDAAGTVAFLSDIPAGSPSALTRTDDTNVTITLGGTPATALLQAVSLTMGWTGQLSPARGGTGVNNGTSTLTLGGNTTFSGAFTFAGTLTGNTAVTFPTSGTLATTSDISSLAVLLTPAGNQTITVGGLTVEAGPFISGTSAGSGTGGSIQLYNAAASAGNFQMYNSTVSTYTTRLTNASVGQFTTITFPDPGSGSASVAYTSQLVTPAALTKTDDTNVTLTLGGSPSTALVNAASLTLGWTGQLSVARGGTGISSFGTGVATALGQNVLGSGGMFLGSDGSFVTTVSCSSVGDLSVAYGNQQGVYTRVGDMVFFNYRVTFTPTFTTASGQVQFGGLPFPCQVTNGVGWCGSISYFSGNPTWPTAGSTLGVLVEAGASYCSLTGVTSAAAQNSLQMSGLATGQPYTFVFTGMYHV